LADGNSRLWDDVTAARRGYPGAVSAVYAWLRRHPRPVDGVLAFPIAIGGIGTGVAMHRLLLIVVALGLAIPIVVRRSHPVGAFATAIVFGAFQVAVFRGRPVVSDVAIVVLLYTLAAYSTRSNSVIGLLICLFGAAMEVLELQIPRPAPSRWEWLIFGYLMFAGPCLTAWVLGDSTRYRRAYYTNLEERAARLERERDAHAQIAAAAERARIARELHDVVAHNVSVMVVQADGAAYALGTDPERTRRALAAISATGRQALTEMRALLGVLRRGDDGGLAVLAPLPGLGQLDELLDQTRAAGLPVTCSVEGKVRPLAAGTALTAYRIIQESLTNVRKHAGGMACANVVLRYSDAAVELSVTDNGVGATAACDGAGHGLTGMSERAAMYGGSVQAGPRAGGGFEVTATLPIVPVHAGAA
jgi:signal transduction histidine kinase